MGDYRYVNPEEMAAVGGLAKWKALFAPAGKYGRLLRGKRLVATIQGEGGCRTLFVHAGLSPDYLKGVVGGGKDPEALLAALNEGAAAQIRSGDFVRSHARDSLWGDHGPLWNRFFSGKSKAVCATVAQTLQQLHCSRMVIGHTVQHGGRIGSRCGGALQLIDVGLSRAYDGHTAAWQCEDGVASALYPDGARALPLAQGGVAAADL